MLRDDPFFWFRETRLTIPGVRGEHRFMHITDTHVNVCDELTTPAEREKFDKQEALWAVYKEKFAKGQLDFARGTDEPYGAPQRISTLAAFEKQLALAEELRPEALLLSGDNLDYMHPAGARYLRRRLAAYPGKFIAVPGNHEDPVCEGVWEAGVRCFAFEGFRIAALDDSRKTVSPEDLAALRAICDEGVPVVVLCHVPLSTPYSAGALSGVSDYFYIDAATADECGRGLIELCVNSDAVRAVICGHVHSYHACELSPGKPQIIGSQGMAGAVHLLTVAGA